MKKYSIAFATILTSLFLACLATTAQAADFEVAIEKDGQTINASIPEDEVFEIKKISVASLEPKFLNKKESMSDYISERLATTKNLSGQEKRSYAKLSSFINSQVLSQVENQAPLDAAWEEKDGLVTKFEPGHPGLYYQGLELARSIVKSLADNKHSINFSPTVVQADTPLDEVNSYGIRGLIGKGSSDFRGSSRNRVQNITVATSRYHGYIIKPDETFSFNDLLGEVDGAHGFAPEMVIKHNGVVPEFGGGVCQASTTVFRTALNAGLPIVERRNHSFAVAYYAPQGTDATTYTGVIDLKFRNDTGNHILVWSEISGTILTFNFYGKPDGRQVEVGSPVRYDSQPSGAFKTALSRKIVYTDGQTKEDVFRSNYRPRAEFTQTTTAQEPVNPNPPVLPTPAPTEPQPETQPNETTT